MKTFREHDAMCIDPTIMVLGGGPSGMAVTIALAQAGFRVATVERTNYEAPRVGEVLPPAAKPLLKSLGVWEEFCHDGHLASPGIVSAWGEGVPYERDFYYQPYGHGWHLDRRKFDFRLAITAEAIGAQVYWGGRVVDVARTATGWCVEVQFTDQYLHLHAKFLVDATGRSSWLARRLGARRVVFDHLVGIVATIECNNGDAHDYRLLLEASECGWWYCTRLPNNTMLAAFMTDADLLDEPPHDLLALWRQRLQSTRFTRKRLENEMPVNTVRTVPANSYCMTSVVGDGWITIGDAAMAWDPLSSHGIMKALGDGRSGAAVVGSVLEGDSSAPQRYSLSVAKALDGYLHSREYFYGMERRWSSSQFWQRRQASNAGNHS